MRIAHVPLLRLQRRLYELPRGPERFQAYLELMRAPDGADLRHPPLVAFNPMGKPPVAETLDALLALDAEQIAQRAVEEAAPRLSGPPEAFSLGLVVADDAHGGWTNRAAAEFAATFDLAPQLKRRWISVLFWTGERPSAEKIRTETLKAQFRSAYYGNHGPALTVRQMLAQETAVARAAGSEPPAAAGDPAVLPYLDQSGPAAAIPCLYGDTAAEALGYSPIHSYPSTRGVQR